MKILLKKLFKIALGVFLMAISAVWFADRAGLVTGGATGIGIVLRELSGRVGVDIPLFITNIIINVPLFLIVFYKRGIRFVALSLYATTMFSFFLYIAEILPNIFIVDEDLFISSVMAGLFMGLGLGIVLKNGATTGGSDMFAEIIRGKRSPLKLPLIINITDTSIIALGLFVFGPVKTLYACLSVFVATFIMDKILLGGRKGKAAWIFTEKSEEIAALVAKKLERGVTFVYAKGYFTGAEKKVVLTVVSDKETTLVKEIVAEADKKAFVMISEVTEVLGEGFSLIE